MEITWRADFDICTILMLILFIAIYRRTKRFKSLSGNLYDVMLYDLLLATAVEYAEVYFSHINPIATPTVKCILLTSYEVLISLLAFIFSLYVFIVAQKGIYIKNKFVWYAIYTPAILTLLLIVTTQATHLVFYFEDGFFHTGPLYFGVYIVIGVYMLFGGIVTAIFRRNILRRDRISFYIFLLFTSVGMIYQAITIGGLVANFLCAIGLILIYFSQQSNYDTMDASSNLYNSRALLIHINELVNTNTAFQLVAFTPDQLLSIMHNSGTLYTDGIIRIIGKRMTELYGSTNTYSLGSGRFAVISFDQWMDDIISAINGSLAEPCIVNSEKFNLTVSGCFLQYPSDFETGDMALELIAKGLDIAQGTGAETFITVQNFDSIRDGLVSRLKQEQAVLKREKDAAEIAKENAQSSEKAKTTFLAYMSHEIRTPLTTIMGMTEILMRNELPEEAQINVDKIKQSSKSLLQIINDILDFSKIEAGHMEIIEDKFDVAPVILSALNVLQVRSAGKPIEIVLDYDKTIPKVLIGDDTRIKQVLYNLCSNAAKYTEQGKITLGVHWNPETCEVDVSVTDTGKGIREEDIPKLFDSFSRFDAHSNKAIEGTGLGLAITKRMIELMGGELKVDSIYGKGSSFYFTLTHKIVDPEPIGDISSSDYTTHIEPVSKLQGFRAPTARILVVDDNAFNRTIVRELIKPHAIIVDEAESGPECISKVGDNIYDLIFLDHMMPGMDGFETLSILLKNPDFVSRHVPVVAFSANAVNGMKEQFQNAGFKDFLSKPIDVNALEKMLLAFLPAEKLEKVSSEEINKKGSLDISIEGIDINIGLEHVGDSLENYFNIIRVILEDRPVMSRKLIKAFEDNDIENYTIEAHALKSNMATIGAMEAAELAKSLEFAGRGKQWDFILENHEKLLATHAQICERIEQALAEYDSRTAVSSANEADDSEMLKTLRSMLPPLDSCLESIKLMLRECEYDMAGSLTCLYARLITDKESGDLLRQISANIASYKYLEAIEILDNYLK